MLVSTMIHLQVHLQIPCYDFYPVQAIAIELFPAIPRPEGLGIQQSAVLSKQLSPGQRRAVCTNGRDVISVS